MPVNNPKWTSEIASQWGKKSGAVRRARAERRLAQLLVLPKPEDKPELVQGISLACIRTRMNQIDELVAKCTDPEDLDRLTRAFERLFRIWQVLTETPDPGRLQPRKKQHIVIDQHLLGPIADSTPQPVVSQPSITPGSDASPSGSNGGN